MTKYREILRLSALGISQQSIADSCNVSKKTVNRILAKSRELNISWPLSDDETDLSLEEKFFPPSQKTASSKKMPDFEYVRSELRRNGVTKKLLWAEYVEDCRLNGEEPLMYSQFCLYVQQDEEKHSATMHIPRKPGEQIEVDWAGDTIPLINSATGEINKAFVFVGVLSYSQYAFVEAFSDMKLPSWIKAHVDMYSFFGGVSRIFVPDNTKTAVIRNRKHDEPQFNESYREMAEHYGVAIIPARVRAPKDKPNAEGAVGNVSTQIIAALRNEQFFSISELNKEIRKRLSAFNSKPFQKKDGSRLQLFLEDESPALRPLPAAKFELAEWKQATVQYNYHIFVDGMLYSVPYEFIHRKVDVKITEDMVEIFCNHKRIASHQKLSGKKGQYSTNKAHMPSNHQEFLEWDGNKFCSWADSIGINTGKVVRAILQSRPIEQQTYRSCMGLLQLSKQYSAQELENACEYALGFTETPSYKSIKNVLASGRFSKSNENHEKVSCEHGLTRGADYYRR